MRTTAALLLCAALLSASPAARAGGLPPPDATGTPSSQHRFNDAQFNNRCFACQTRVTWRVTDRTRRVLGTLDPAKTAACRAGDFVPQVHAQYVVVANDADLDVAWGDGRNLRDGRRLGRPGEVYLFFEAGWWVDTREHRLRLKEECEVYVRRD